jgi:hypothetical protein
MSGYFSVADRGTFGHWDISDERGRHYTIRGDMASGFDLCDERRHPDHRLARIPFASPFEALEYAARQIMPESETPA